MNTLFEFILKPVLSFVAKPEILMPVASVALVLTLKYYRTVTQPRIAGPIGLALAGLLVISCFEPNFQKNILKPDNVPIVLLLFSVFFFLWPNFYISCQGKVFSTSRREHAGLLEEDLVRVLHYPHSLTVESIERYDTSVKRWVPAFSEEAEIDRLVAEAERQRRR